MTFKQQSEKNTYHPIESVLNKFKNGETFSTSIEEIQKITHSELSLLVDEQIKEVKGMIKMIGTDIQDISPTGLAFNSAIFAVLDYLLTLKKEI